MARLVFTRQLRRFVEAPDFVSARDDLRAALDDAFDAHPMLRGYILDDQGHLRPNVVIFVDGRRCTDPTGLRVPLAPDSQVHVLQALSGG